MAEKKQIVNENIARNILLNYTRVFFKLFTWYWSEHKKEIAKERNSHKNLNFRDKFIWDCIMPAPLCYSLIRRLTVIAVPTYATVSISISCTITNFNHIQCHKYLSAVYNVNRAVMLRYINMDNCVLFCMFKRKKSEMMHCFEEESKLDCKFRLRAWYTPTQHRTPDYDTYLVR